VHTNSNRPQDFYFYFQICDIEHLVKIFKKTAKLVEFKIEKKSRNNPIFFSNKSQNLSKKKNTVKQGQEI